MEGYERRSQDLYIGVYHLSKDQVEWQRPADWEDLVDRHLYRVTPLQELSIDSLGPLPQDEFGMRYIILIVDNFSNFVGLLPAKNTSMLEFLKAFLSWVGIFGAPKILRSDVASQFL